MLKRKGVRSCSRGRQEDGRTRWSRSAADRCWRLDIETDRRGREAKAGSSALCCCSGSLVFANCPAEVSLKRKLPSWPFTWYARSHWGAQPSLSHAAARTPSLLHIKVSTQHFRTKHPTALITSSQYVSSDSFRVWVSASFYPRFWIFSLWLSSFIMEHFCRIYLAVNL